MMDNKEIYNMITLEEGIKDTVYICPAGARTVGIGHNLNADPAIHILHKQLKKGDKITKEQIQQLYDYDINKITKAIQKQIPYFTKLLEKYQYILINMTFQLGTNGIMKWPNLLTAMRTKDDNLIVNNLLSSKLYKQTPNRVNRMIKLIHNDID